MVKIQHIKMNCHTLINKSLKKIIIIIIRTKNCLLPNQINHRKSRHFEVHAPPFLFCYHFMLPKFWFSTKIQRLSHFKHISHYFVVFSAMFFSFWFIVEELTHFSIFLVCSRTTKEKKNPSIIIDWPVIYLAMVNFEYQRNTQVQLNNTINIKN